MNDKIKGRTPDIISGDSTPPEQLSAWARWQLPNMEAELPPKQNALNIRKQKHKNAAPQTPEPEPEIKPPTLEEIEAIRQAAFDTGHEEGRAAGHEEGHKKGYETGYKQGEGEVKAAVTRLGQIARVLLEPIPKNDDDLEEALLQMVENICKRVVQRELKLDSSGLKKIVNTALENLHPGAQRLRIHLNPGDCEMITLHLNAMGELEDNWRVVPHATITPGGCIIETDNSLIDARAERQLAAVIAQVFERQSQALETTPQPQGGMEQLLGEVDTFEGDAFSLDDEAEGAPDEP